MNYNENVKLGELLEIEFNGSRVRTKVQEIISDMEYVILHPTLKGALLHMESNEIKITFYRPNGCYCFTAKVIKRFRKENIMLCILVRISTIKRNQRRQCYRLAVVLDVLLYELDEEGKPSKSSVRAKTIDLSEKSMAVSSFTALKRGEKFLAEIQFPNLNPLMMNSKVLRTYHSSESNEPHRVVLIFMDDHETERAYIRRYIFKQQILLRQSRNDKKQ